MINSDYTLDYAASAVQHLGVGLYKQLPQALAELITNCWDADATKISIQINYKEKTISITDNGNGMSHDELNSDFLRVAKNRRTTSDTDLSQHGRKVTGKKGLGKLALFGIANRIQVVSIKNGLKNGFEMNFNVIQNTNEDEKYHPQSLFFNEKTKKSNSTEIKINELTLKSITSLDNLKKSLARRFNKYSQDNFLVEIKDENGNFKTLDETAFEQSIRPPKTEFTYKFPDDYDVSSNVHLKKLKDENITGTIFTNPTPLRSNQAGFSVLARGKLASEQSTKQFNERANDYFYSYAVGYFNIDLVDEDLKNDYISTDRQSILWNSSENLVELRNNLNKLINATQKMWRKNWDDRKNKAAKETINSANDANNVLKSPHLIEKDKKLLEDIADSFGNTDVSIPEKTKKNILNEVAKSTQTYKHDNSVYTELIPKSFVVPKNIGSKIRRLREETVRLETSNNTTDECILAQGLLLRAILDTTTTTLLVKYREEINTYGSIFKNQLNYDKNVYDLKLKEKYHYMIKLFDKKQLLSNTRSANILIGHFDGLKVTEELDVLMHDNDQWPKFEKLKAIWEEICPNLLQAFKLIKN